MDKTLGLKLRRWEYSLKYCNKLDLLPIYCLPNLPPEKSTKISVGEFSLSDSGNFHKCLAEANTDPIWKDLSSFSIKFWKKNQQLTKLQNAQRNKLPWVKASRHREISFLKISDIEVIRCKKKNLLNFKVWRNYLKLNIEQKDL